MLEAGKCPAPRSPIPLFRSLSRSASKLLLTRRKNLPLQPLARGTWLGIVSGAPTAWLLIKSAEALWQQRPIAGRLSEHPDAGSGYMCCALLRVALLSLRVSCARRRHRIVRDCGGVSDHAGPGDPAGASVL